MKDIRDKVKNLFDILGYEKNKPCTKTILFLQERTGMMHSELLDALKEVRAAEDRWRQEIKRLEVFYNI